MKVNNISNQNITRQSFKGSETNIYQETSGKVKDITDKYIGKDQIKSPGQIVLSMGLIALKTFVCGAGAAALLATLSKSAPSKTIKALKTASNEIIGFSKKVIDNPTTKLQKATNFVKKSAGTVEEVARNVYKKVICHGFEAIPENATTEVVEKIVKNNEFKAFTNLGGTAAVASLAPSIIKKDENEDGVLDIVQKAQKRSEQLDNKFSALGQDVIAMTQLTNMLK